MQRGILIRGKFVQNQLDSDNEVDDISESTVIHSLNSTINSNLEELLRVSEVVPETNFNFRLDLSNCKKAKEETK